MTVAVFWVLAVLAAASGFMVFRFNSMARVTIALLVAFLATGGLGAVGGVRYSVLAWGVVFPVSVAQALAVSLVVLTGGGVPL